MKIIFGRYKGSIPKSVVIKGTLPDGSQWKEILQVDIYFLFTIHFYLLTLKSHLTILQMPFFFYVA